MTEPGVPAASRRAMLAGACASACAVALAGCARYSSSSGIAGSQPAPGSPGSAGAGGASVLATTAEIPVGGGKILASQKIVITQPKAGSFDAFTAICTHAGCTVSTVAAGTIDCPCHGSKFSIADGAVVNGPATRPLARISIKVKGNSIAQA